MDTDNIDCVDDASTIDESELGVEIDIYQPWQLPNADDDDAHCQQQQQQKEGNNQCWYYEDEGGKFKTEEVSR